VSGYEIARGTYPLLEREQRWNTQLYRVIGDLGWQGLVTTNPSWYTLLDQD